MYLKNLTAVNFKNFQEVVLDCVPRLNCFIGDNGAGKTNLLDAIYYLSFTKSFFNSVDHMNVRHGENWFMLKGFYNRTGKEEEIICSYQESQKKQIKRNSKAYRKMSEHIGLLPLVMVSPGDSVLIMGGSEERRRFMDGVISQFDSGYLHDLIRYNRVLMQRNNLLKQVSQGQAPDVEVIDVYDGQLAESGTKIFERRISFIRDMVPVFQKYYSIISRGVEAVGLEYLSDLSSGPMYDQLKATYARDRMVQYTTAGIHKDDMSLILGDHPMKRIGSQGQQKTYLIALKLAQFEFIANVSGIKPILLLDDIFDKLDKNRVEQIVKLVSGDQFGQIFITDTNREHLDAILRSVTSDYRLFMVTNGKTEGVS
ncbi:MAG TPA: DNA replication and repair protein RecF [Prolixibacteraceae bacterium]|nr:DNA replication and repair protein RecF [Prolixibacteraceae bacterium]